MSTALLAFIVAASLGTWIYTKLARQAGSGNVGNAAIGAGLAGLVIFVVVFSLLKLLGL